MSLLIDIAHTFQHLSEEQKLLTEYKWPKAFDDYGDDNKENRYLTEENEQWLGYCKQTTKKVDTWRQRNVVPNPIQHEMCGFVFFLFATQWKMKKKTASIIIYCKNVFYHANSNRISSTDYFLFFVSLSLFGLGLGLCLYLFNMRFFSWPFLYSVISN